MKHSLLLLLALLTSCVENNDLTLLSLPTQLVPHPLNIMIASLLITQ